MKAIRCVVILSLAAAPLSAASMEVSLTPRAVISPFTYWGNNPGQGRFYGPTGIRVGNELFMYVQGGAYSNVTCGGQGAGYRGTEIIVTEVNN